MKADANYDWLVTPSGGQYFFTSTTSAFGGYRLTALGWSFEAIVNGEAFFPSGAWSPNNDIVVAYRTAALGEQRLNFSRKLNTTGEWFSTKLNNDCGTFGGIKVFVNDAANVYIRYYTTDNYITVVTFR
jgi:hypothetical protein